MMNLMTTAETFARLDALMNERRLELGLRWGTVAELADISVQTLGAVRKGSNPPSDLTKRGIEKALQWETGSINHILAGGEPILDGRPPQTLTTTAGDDLATALAIVRELEAKFARRKGPRTQRQQRGIQMLKLAIDDLTEALDEDGASR